MDYILESLKSFSGLEFSYSPETGEITIHKGDIDKEQIILKSEEIKAAEPMRLLRIERDRLLAESDWRDLPSYPSADQAAWRNYRQQLRDLPANTEDTSNPTWPTKPETD